ncbi:16S rRNA (guanine(527)-N(7))-methyltransferase RsmG [Leptolyngbya sp. NIES-2104]|uniref:16S rRNA (guanine(527)-N(7))-methyltransferase RsmG n=1 Tax=Leptolyngbya sp. NIES-2104 TaxID=1552121 RepID=UPI0006ECA7C3|nr:16S rRNA (guanine(527)-N(7))-methyltransferase RsmG [Leptolyngbya sp. NIES-2104]GAP96017.1 rRNA small subunit 7-methylguanosine (m7G) methyltransferase GidB [Leptolyngbya sp. NIES-2104]
MLVALPEMIDLWKSTTDWFPDETVRSQFQQFYELVLQGNQQQNLTRITEPVDFWEKHLWDSLRGVFPKVTGSNLSAIDIGTGAGFPGIPMAIARSDWKITLLDSTRKKVNFLQDSTKALGLTNVRSMVDRVEQVGQSSGHREAYDLATIRAVAAASVCAEYALPLLKIGGIAVLYRGQWTDEEAIALDHAAKELGGVVEECDRFETPLTHGVRHCLYLRKTSSTPLEFPRAIGIPTQDPL